MPTVDEIFDDAVSLPVEERLRLIDTLLETVRPKNPKIDEKWIQVALRRRDELRSGKVKGIPGEEAMEKIRKRLEK
ncbi:MAG: addiction module protein [Planctomycetes bacterium]|nr:addiction module protein [Planctomycetota bacterium]